MAAVRSFETFEPVYRTTRTHILLALYPLRSVYVETNPSVSNDMSIGYRGLSKKMDGIWNRYNLKSTGRIYTFGILKCSEKFKVLDLP